MSPVGAAEASIFAKIVRGEIPCQRVFENEHLLAFLDINPLAEGHTLVISKHPVARLEELPPETAAELARVLPLLTRKVLAATGASDCNVLLNNGAGAGQEIPYVHVHIIPRQPGDGLGYRWKPQKRAPEELTELAERIRAQS